MLMDANQDVERELAAVETLALPPGRRPPRRERRDVARRLRRARFRRQTPAIFFDGVIEDAGDGAVTLDNELGIDAARGASRRARARADRRCSPARSGRARGLRVCAGFDEAMAAHGVTGQERYVKVCEWDIADGRRAALELLADPDRATA